MNRYFCSGPFIQPEGAWINSLVNDGRWQQHRLLRTKGSTQSGCNGNPSAGEIDSTYPVSAYRTKTFSCAPGEDGPYLGPGNQRYCARYRDVCSTTPYPVAISDGSKYYGKIVDLPVFERFRFYRSYTSLPSFSGVGGLLTAAKPAVDPDGGSVQAVGWSTSYDARVWVTTDSAGLTKVFNVDIPGENLRSFVQKPEGLVALQNDATSLGMNASGDLSFSHVDSSIWRFDKTGRLQAIDQAAGPSVTLTYANNGQLSSATDRYGQTLRFALTPEGMIDRITAPNGHVIQYGFDAGGHLASIGSLGRSGATTKQYLYENTKFPGAVTGEIDEKGFRLSLFTYDDYGRVIKTERFGNSSGLVTSYRFDFTSPGTPKVTDPLGTTRSYTFVRSGYGRLKSVNQPGGSGCGAASSNITYDGNGNVLVRWDFNGYLTRYTYDSARNLETQRKEGLNNAGDARPESRTVSTAWHSYWRFPVKIAEAKKLTTYVYNGDIDPATGSALMCAPAEATIPKLSGGAILIGVLCKKTEQATADITGAAGLTPVVTGSPKTWTYTYNINGQMLTADGPRTDVSDLTTISYYGLADADLGKRGNVATISNALGHVTRITAYDLNRNPLTIIDPNNVVTSLTYDEQGRLTSRTVGNESSTYNWDSAGLLTQITLPDGRTLTYSYDAGHQLTAITDAEGNHLVYTLDAMGNRIREDVKDPLGQLAQTRSRVYDPLSRLAQDIGGQGQVTRYEYDPNGNQTKVTDPLGHSTTSGYDALNRLITLTDPGNCVIRYTYDGQDQLTQVSDPRALVTTYTIDGLGNRTQTASPDTGIATSSYDAAGNELSRTDARGQQTTTTYDALNRPIQLIHQDGRQVNYTWDVGSNGKGRLTGIDELSNGLLTDRLQYIYDEQGRVIHLIRTTGSLIHSQSYTYASGQLSGQTLPSGRQISYTRNTAGQITQIELTDSAEAGSGQKKTIASAISYHPFGGIREWTDGAGQIHRRARNLDGQISSYSLGNTLWQLSMDSAGRITGQSDASNPQNSGTYGYDIQDRLTSAALPTGRYGYGYDATGNRTSQSQGGNTRTVTIAPTSNRLTALSNPPRNFTYDKAGNTIDDGTAQYTYDARGRLVAMQSATDKASYHLNALGQRIRKTLTNNGQIVSDTLYHYDLAGHLIGESDGTGKVSREILWLDDTPLAVLQ